MIDLMKKLIYRSLILAFAGLLLAGCKPTEKNYRSAYDAAQAKRQAAATADDGLLPVSVLESTDGPRRLNIGGTEIYTQAMALSGAELGTYNVAVGAYSMDTNAKALAEKLRGEGYADACVALGSDSKIYVVAAHTDGLEDAAAVVAQFRNSHPGFPYSGLPGAPVVLIK